MPLFVKYESIIIGSVKIPPDLKEKVDSVFMQFDEEVERISKSRGLKRAMVRSRLACCMYAFVNSFGAYVVAAPMGPLSSGNYQEALERPFNLQDVVNEGVMEYGLKDAFGLFFRRGLIDSPPEPPDRREEIRAMAEQFVEMEVQRFVEMTSLISISPVFGPAHFRVRNDSCFVLMPFKEELTEVYQSVVRPTVESLGLVCHRADEIPSNKAIMQDIWKSICEARIVIADLTGRNPNVFYELGIAHTLGKETILISQSEDEPAPFDVTHIRQIRYKNTARGADELKRILAETIKSIMQPVTISA